MPRFAYRIHSWFLSTRFACTLRFGNLQKTLLSPAYRWLSGDSALVLLALATMTSGSPRASAQDAAAASQAEAVRALIEALKDKDVDVRISAIQSLRRIGEEAQPAVPALLDLLKDSDVEVRGHATLALSYLAAGDASVVPGLTELLKDSDRQIRSAAALSLMRIGEVSLPAVPALKELAKQDDRQSQLYALVRAGPAGRQA